MLSKIDLLTGSGEVSENEDNDGMGTAIGHPEEKCQAEDVQPKRDPPPPPKRESISAVAADLIAKAKLMDDGYVAVDGLSNEQIEEYFRESCDEKGLVGGQKAREFFQRTGLPTAVLSDIWKSVKPPHQQTGIRGLNRHQFSLFLRLVAFVQKGYDMENEELLMAALDPGVWAEVGAGPLEAPELQSPRKVDVGERSSLGIEHVTSNMKPLVGRELKAAGSYTSLPPLAYEVRYPPLKSDESAKLNALIGVDGFLFAYPSFGNGMLIWGSAEGKIAKLEAVEEPSKSLLRFAATKPHQAVACPREDSDAATCVEIENITYKSKKISCCYMDHDRSVMWVADREGWVTGYSVKDIDAKALAREHLIHQWRAFRVGYVSAMTVAIDGALWTGSSRGVMRVWPHAAGPPTIVSMFKPFSSDNETKARELRRSAFDRAHGSKIIALHSAADGYIIWSATAKDILLWDVGSGMCYGMIGHSNGSSPLKRANFFSETSGTPVIEKDKGMEVDPLNGAVLWRPTREDYGYCHSQQESWAQLSERSVVELTERITDGAGKAVKLFGKLGGKLSGTSSISKHTLEKDSMEAAPAQVLRSDIFSMIAPFNNTIWVAYLKGNIEIYSAAGKLQDSIMLGVDIACMACIGREIWVGTLLGDIVRVGIDEKTVRGRFRAHRCSLKSITQVGIRAYTLAADGSISGWSVEQGPRIHESCWKEFKALGAPCFSRASLGVLAVTWNCGESRPSPSSPFFRWISENSSDKSLIVISLQEVEMGGTSVAIAVAKETLSAKSQERGNANAQFWVNTTSASLGRHWYHVSLRQLSGMIVMVFARTDISKDLGAVHTSAVACGILGVGGNKGAVAVQLTLFRHHFAFICSHFAAHQHAVDVRNANYYTVLKDLNFKTVQSIFEEDDDETDYVDENMPSLQEESAIEDDVFSTQSGGAKDSTPSPPNNSENEFLRYVDGVFWMGDFNYRIDGNYEQVCELIAARELHPLLLCDQLKREHTSGRVFKGFEEPEIAFPPTYKFDKGATGELAYDSSEKRRIPAWCDRIMYRGNVPLTSNKPSPLPDSLIDSERKIEIIPTEYSCWMDVVDSDHKPVYGAFKVLLTKTDAVRKRDTVADILSKHIPQRDSIPRFSIAPHTLRLHPFHMPDQMVHIQNKGKNVIFFTIHPVRPEDALVVEVRPARGLIEPSQSKEIFLKANASDRDASLRNIMIRVTVFPQDSVGSSKEIYTKTGEFHALLLGQ
eukprot:jgi/Picre1/27801/NNA_000765.t1